MGVLQRSNPLHNLQYTHPFSPNSMMMPLRLQLPLPLPPRSPQNPNPNPNSLRSSFTTLRPLPPASSSSSSSLFNSGLRFREKLLYLEHHLGLDSSLALAANPSLRSASLPSIRAAAAPLLSHGLSPLDAGRVFSMYPHLLTSDPHLSLLPVLRFLLGPAAIPFPDLRKSLVRCPRLLVSSVPGQLTPALYFLRRLGFIGTHRITCNTTLLLVSSVERTLIPKLDYLCSLGFSYREATWMVRRSPGLLTFSIKNNYRPKVEFLVGEMGRDVGEIKEFPQYFSFSLDGKIKPRHRMLKEKGFSMPLAEMLKISDGEFRERLLEMRIGSVDGRM